MTSHVSDSGSEVSYVLHGRHLCGCGCGKWADIEFDGYRETYLNRVCRAVECRPAEKLQWARRLRCTSFAQRSMFEILILSLPEVSEILRTFVDGDIYRHSCPEECGRCRPEWFDRGWICPEFWRPPPQDSAAHTVVAWGLIP